MITPLDLLKSNLSKLDIDLETKIETNSILNIINLSFSRKFNLNNLLNRSNTVSAYIEEFIQINDLSEWLLNNRGEKIKKYIVNNAYKNKGYFELVDNEFKKIQLINYSILKKCFNLNSAYRISYNNSFKVKHFITLH